MATPKAGYCLELEVIRVLGEYACSPEVRKCISTGTFEGYLAAETARSRFYYEKHTDYAYDYLLTQLLSKWKGWDSGIDTKSVALQSWTAAERQCQVVNGRLNDAILRGKDPRVLHFTSEVQRKIESVLGPLRLYKALRRSRWSNGATAITRRGATVHEKMSAPIAVTRRALSHLRVEIENDPRWAEALTGFRPAGPFCLLPNQFEVIEWSRWMTVPKNAKTDRCIAAEPAGNSFLQQGVGRYIRDRLKRFGVDLDDQSINQNLARFAYEHGLATLDLKAASDTISRSLVWLLLPSSWAEYLDDLRTSYTQLPDGSKVHLQKFSSMGNAYTFELESLIFWAISTVASEESNCSISPFVYGDDIVVDRDCFHEVVEWLTFYGFQVNLDKSFKDGPFFESCGKQYWSNADVTPPYQKEVVSRNSEIIRFANRLTRWWMQHGSSLDDDKSIALLCAVTMICSCWRGRVMPLVPFGDDGFISDRSALPPVDPNHGFRCKVYRFFPATQCDDVITVDRYGVARITAISYLALKLRDPSASYTDRFGRVERSLKGGIWRLTNAWIPDWDESGRVYPASDWCP